MLAHHSRDVPQGDAADAFLAARPIPRHSALHRTQESQVGGSGGEEEDGDSCAQRLRPNSSSPRGHAGPSKEVGKVRIVVGQEAADTLAVALRSRSARVPGPARPGWHAIGRRVRGHDPASSSPPPSGGPAASLPAESAESGRVTGVFMRSSASHVPRGGARSRVLLEAVHDMKPGIREAQHHVTRAMRSGPAQASPESAAPRHACAAGATRREAPSASPWSSKRDRLQVVRFGRAQLPIPRTHGRRPFVEVRALPASPAGPGAGSAAFPAGATSPLSRRGGHGRRGPWGARSTGSVAGDRSAAGPDRRRRSGAEVTPVTPRPDGEP